MSDEILLFLVKKIPSCVDVFRLSETCTRMARICRDATLWIRVDTRHSNPLSLREFRKLLPWLGERTKSLAIQGFMSTAAAAATPSDKQNLSPSQLNAVARRCPNLEELILQDCFVDASRITVSTLPPTLETLRINSCEFVNTPTRESYFKTLNERVPQLKVLDLRDSPWVTNHSLMAICKIEELREVDLRGCFRMGECFAYTALACRFGFRKVEKLDLRDTTVGDQEAACFSRLPELRQLYLGFTKPVPTASEDAAQNKGVTDKGLRNLCAPSSDPADFESKLEVLSLTNLAGVTDSMLPMVATSLTRLSVLEVAGTKVTKEGAGAVVARRPGCNVVMQ